MHGSHGKNLIGYLHFIWPSRANSFQSKDNPVHLKAGKRQCHIRSAVHNVKSRPLNVDGIRNMEVMAVSGRHYSRTLLFRALQAQASNAARCSEQVDSDLDGSSEKPNLIPSTLFGMNTRQQGRTSCSTDQQTNASVMISGSSSSRI